jgi:ribosomal protein S5
VAGILAAALFETGGLGNSEPTCLKPGEAGIGPTAGGAGRELATTLPGVKNVGATVP